MANKTLFSTTTGGTVKDSDVMAYKEAGTSDDGTRNHLFSVMKTYFQGLLPSRITSLETTVAGYGTAALGDAQTSLTDTTADRLMKVGAFGLGVARNSGVNQLSAGSDLNTITRNGLYYWDAAPSNAPPAAGGADFCTMLQTSRFYEMQIVFSTTGGVWKRYNSSGGWSTWVEILSEDNYPSDTTWTTVTSLDNGWTGEVRYIIRAGMVTVVAVVDGSSASTDVILTLGIAYRPAVEISGVSRLAISGNIGFGIVNTSGQVRATTGDVATRFTATYPVL